jgi:pimeloyl-ACP methyl ester carboxylesterase
MSWVIQRRYLVLAVLLAILSLSIYASSISRLAFGDISIKKQDILRGNGRVVSFRVYKPAVNTYGQPFPAVLTIHGISSSGAMIDAYNIELARRNFTVVSVDIAGHGRSLERFGFDAFFEAVMDAYDAVRYVQLHDPDTDDSLYGILGHSLGAGISLLFSNMTIKPASTIIIGGGIGNQFGGLELPINESIPQNMMIAVGIYDELVTQQAALDTLKIATGLNDPDPGMTYGNFTEGTARRLVFSATNHLFEISDSTIVTESIDWLGRALQGEQQTQESMLDPTSHIYQYASGFDLLAAISFIFTIFPLVLITYSHIPVNWKPEIAEKLPAALETKSAIKFSVVLGVFTSILFLLLMLFGFVFEFTGLSLIPVSFGTALSLISISTALIVFVVSRKYVGKEQVQETMFELYSGWKHFFGNMISALVILLPALVWIFGVSFVARLGLDNPLAITFATDSGASLFRFLYMTILVFLMLPIFYADTLWLNISIGVSSMWNSTREMVQRVVQALISRLLGWLLIIAFLYLPFLAGLQLGFIMFIALLMLPFTVFIGLTILLTVWVGGITQSNIAPALLNAVLFAIIISSTFQLV